MKLKVLSAENMETIRQWREEVPETLRTPFDLTYEQQQDYYHGTICDRRGTTRYWGIWVNNQQEVIAYGEERKAYVDLPENILIGYGGIEHIEWENGRGEISLLIDSEFRRMGFGTTAAEIILDKAFRFMRLANVYGECYKCSPAVPFWERLIEKHEGYSTHFPGTKFYEGRLYGSYLFNFPYSKWRPHE